MEHTACHETDIVFLLSNNVYRHVDAFTQDKLARSLYFHRTNQHLHFQSCQYASTVKRRYSAWRDRRPRGSPASWRRTRRKYRSPGNSIIQWRRWTYLRRTSRATVHARQPPTHRWPSWTMALSFAGAAMTKALSSSRASTISCQLVSARPHRASEKLLRI